jgi:AcrR family transcriptional regulator
MGTEETVITKGFPLAVGAARSAHRSSREESIVETARGKFAAKGYEATSVAEIAQEVGVVEGTIYTYFESKRAILHRVIAEFYETLIAEVETSLSGISGVRNQIRYLVWRQLRAFVEEPQFCYLIIRELQPTADSYDSIVVGLARRYTALAVQVVQKGIQSGEVRPNVSPMTVRAMLYGSVENVAWRLAFRQKPIDIAQISEDITALLCRGILATEADETVSAAERLATLIAEMQTILSELRASGSWPPKSEASQ